MRRTIIGVGYAGVIATCGFMACGGSSTDGSSGSSSGGSGGGSGSSSSGNAASGTGSGTSGTLAGTGFSGSGLFNPDAGFNFDAFTFPDNFTFSLPDGFGTPTGTCAQLSSCCNALTNALQKLECGALATINDQPTCQQMLASFQDGGQCH